jgi:hypothetical protein
MSICKGPHALTNIPQAKAKVRGSDNPNANIPILYRMWRKAKIREKRELINKQKTLR